MDVFFSKVEEGDARKQAVRPVPAFTYMVERTLDATAEFNPRNVVSFLGAARGFELARCQNLDPDVARVRVPVSQDSMVGHGGESAIAAWKTPCMPNTTRFADRSRNSETALNALTTYTSVARSTSTTPLSLKSR